MAEYRHDPLHNRWVIVGSQRAGRPLEFEEQVVRRVGEPCPFCEGNEGETPPALATYGGDSNGNWSVRVVPNKYPAVDSEVGANGHSGGNGLFTSRPAIGLHEVIVESPRHVASLSELTIQECETVFAAYQDRLQSCQRGGGFQYAQVFKNAGPAAGATIEHSHSQFLALPHVPIHVREELDHCRRYFQQHGRRLLADIQEQELTRGERIVAHSERLVAFCPWASRFPYEVWIVPRQPQANFASASSAEVSEAAHLTREIVGRIESALGNVGYNFLLHSQPFDTAAYDYYHWHIELFPRITKVAGFEWSTGVFINTVTPETAAVELRHASLTAGKNLAAVPTRKTS